MSGGARLLLEIRCQDSVVQIVALPVLRDTAELIFPKEREERENIIHGAFCVHVPGEEMKPAPMAHVIEVRCRVRGILRLIRIQIQAQPRQDRAESAVAEITPDLSFPAPFRRNDISSADGFCSVYDSHVLSQLTSLALCNVIIHKYS